MRRLLLMICLICSTISSFAENQFSLSASDGNRGEEITVSAQITLDEDVTAAQIVIPLGQQLHYVENSTFFNSCKLEGFTTSAFIDGNELIIHLYSVSLRYIEKGTLNLFTFKVKLGDVPGTYEIKPQGKLSDAKGKAVACSFIGDDITLYSASVSVDKLLTFDEVLIGTQYTKRLNVRNDGNKTLHVASVLPSSDIITVSESTFALEPGAVKSIEVKVDATARGVYKENIQLISDASQSIVYCNIDINAVSWNNVTLPSSVSARGGEETVVPIGLDNFEDVIALEFDMELPDGVILSENSAVVADRTNGFNVSAIQSGNVVKFILYSLSGKVITAGNGTIIEFKLIPSVYPGNYRFAISNLKVINRNNDNVAYGDESRCELSIRSPRMRLSPNEFSEFFVKGNSSECVMELTNNGDEELVIDKIVINNENYKLENVNFPITIPTGMSFFVNYSFCPQKAAVQEMEVNIFSNDPVTPLMTKKYAIKVVDGNFLSLDGEMLGTTDFLMHVGLNNKSDITAVQMDINYPGHMILDKTSFDLSDRIKDTHTVNVSSIEPGKYRVLIYSNTNSIIKGGDGELLSVLFVNSGNNRIYHSSFSIDNVLLGDKKGVNLNSIERYNFNILYYYYCNSLIGNSSSVENLICGTGTPIIPKYSLGGSFSVIGNSDKVLYACNTSSGDQCEVAFRDANKTLLKKTKVPKGSLVSTPYIRDVNGKLFYGWSDGHNILSCKKNSTIIVNGNCEIYPVYTDDLFASASNLTIDKGKYSLLRVLMGEPKRIVEDDITWYSSNEEIVLVNTNGIITALRSGHATITAKVSNVESPVVFDINVADDFCHIYVNAEKDGTGEVLVSGSTYDSVTNTVVQGDQITIKANPIEGYQFESWSSNGKEVSRSNPYVLTVNEDMNITAKVVPKQYKVTFMIDDAIYATIYVLYGDRVSLSSTPTKQGCSFMGWNGIPETMPAHDVVVVGTFSKTFKPGDANNSGEVNVSDITAVVSHIYGQTPANFNAAAADVNNSGEINVADITGIVSIIYGGSASSTKGAPKTQVDELTLALPTVTANAGTHVRVPVYIDRANAVSAFQFDLALPENILVSDVECNPDERQCVGAYMADGKFRIVSYSLRNENFVNVSAPVGYINLSVDALAAPGVYKLSLSSAVTSSTGNEFKTNVANGTLIVSSPTGIDNIDDEGTNTREVTTLGGARMNSNAKLPKGVYIVNGKKQVVR